MIIGIKQPRHPDRQVNRNLFEDFISRAVLESFAALEKASL
ncbi:hypothetical protein OAJ44_00175 [Chloroflexi bacterium]|nr:hypothetical protein [Chloroflexota bacterium]